MKTNGIITRSSIQKSTIVTTMDQNALNYEEVEAFTDMAYEANSFLKGIRHENRKSSKGTIDKVGVRGRNMRSKKRTSWRLIHQDLPFRRFLIRWSRWYYLSISLKSLSAKRSESVVKTLKILSCELWLITTAKICRTLALTGILIHLIQTRIMSF